MSTRSYVRIKTWPGQRAGYSVALSRASAEVAVRENAQTRCPEPDAAAWGPLAESALPHLKKNGGLVVRRVRVSISRLVICIL